MSDNIPFEIQEEIMKRLPVKSLIRFRSVSKPWKSLIGSSKFINDLRISNTQSHHLLVSYFDLEDSMQKYVSILDDDNYTFPRFPLTIPVSVKLINEPKIVSSSQFGLFCLYGFYGEPSDTSTKKVVIWNPTIRKSVDIEIPNVLTFPYETVIGFGVCPQTNDPKIIKISCYYNDQNTANITSLPWQVEVFTLSSRVWRSPLCNNLPRKSINLLPSQVDIELFIYWLADDTNSVNSELHGYNLIMSFDMTSEEFTQICLPDSLAHKPRIDLQISKLRESLVVLEYTYIYENRNEVCNVWKMEHGVTKSFTKLFIISIRNTSIINVLGFRISGELVIELKNKDHYLGELVVYKPYSKKLDYIGVSGKRNLFSVRSYTETLLLLDH